MMMRNPAFIILGALTLALAGCPAPSQAAAAPPPQPYTRIANPDTNTVQLQIALRKFVPAQHRGPGHLAGGRHARGRTRLLPRAAAFSRRPNGRPLRRDQCQCPPASCSRCNRGLLQCARARDAANGNERRLLDAIHARPLPRPGLSTGRD